jgi:hypothetical protein
MFINSIESLIRDGYQIHVSLAGEVYVYFSSESQPFQHEVWNRDAELIRVFLAGRHVSGYFSLVAKEIRALSPSVAPTSLPTTNADAKPALKSVAESVAEPIPAAPAPFKPNLVSCAEPPAQSPDFLETLTGANNEYVVYAKADSSFHIHWKVSRKVAKEVWRRDRSHIQQWLGADVLNTVSWEESSAKAKADKAPKWKEISAEQTKVRTVVRQLVAFGKPVADLAQLDDGTYHVYFHVPKEEAKRLHAHIKNEFTGYEVTSVSFEEPLTRRQEWVDEFHCVDPIATEHDSVAVSDKELYRFLTQRIDGNSLIQDDSFRHQGHCWVFKASDLSLSTLAQLAFCVSSFSVGAKENASRIAHTLLNGKTVILTD